MSLPSTTVWEVRTTGSDSNGGGFNAARSGTDYSQQDAAQFSGTDLVIDGTTTTKVTAAGHTFVAADRGNIIHITSGAGFTAGFYEVVSVSSGAATLDRAVGTAGSTGGTWALGGALATVAGTRPGLLQQTNRRTVYIQAGTGYALSSTNQFLICGVTRYIGYSATRGDNGRVTFTATEASFNMGWDSNTETSRVAVANLIFDGGGYSAVNGIYGQYGNTASIGFVNCKFYRLAAAISGFSSLNARPQFLNCEIIDSTATPITAPQTYLFGCTLSGSAAYHINAANVVVINCILANSASAGLYGSNTYVYLDRCVIYGSGGNGVSTAGDYPVVIRNSIFVDNSGYGISISYNTDKRWGAVHNCAYYNNTSGQFSDPESIPGFSHLTDITLTADPFVDAANGDFRLNNTAGGGALCRAAGIGPAGQTNAIDIGAVQHADAGGSVLIIEDD